MSRKTCLFILAVMIVLLLFPCCSKKTPEVKAKSYFEYFDTVSYVYSYAQDSNEVFEERAQKVAKVLEKYHRLLDIYHEYSGINNLCTVNKNAGKEPVKVDSELIEFLCYAKEMYSLTNKKMNIAMGPVLSLWHDARTSETHYVPDKSELKEASKYISIDNLEIDRENGTVRLSNSNSLLDVGAIGKGYAAEKAAQELEKDGVSSYVINIGGNVRIIGKKPNNTGWKTGIRNPNAPDGPFALMLEISDCSCVTSGTYERFFTVDGNKYHHIIDSETLFPASYFESVTVICHDSALADSLSTALFCMKREEGLELLEKLDRTDCVWITSDGTIYYTDGVKEYLIDEK